MTRAFALELARDVVAGYDMTPDAKEHLLTLARALIAESERVERLEVVVSKVPALGEYIVNMLPIERTAYTFDNIELGHVQLGRAKFAIKQLGVLIQDADALINGEEAKDATKESNDGG